MGNGSFTLSAAAPATVPDGPELSVCASASHAAVARLLAKVYEVDAL